jgi:ATP-dependent DNA ligase
VPEPSFLDDGWSDFHALLTRRGGAQAALVSFDLLRLGGLDLRQRSLEARCQALELLVAKRRGDGILFNEALERPAFGSTRILRS